ncbi:MAG: hypothetical protein ACLQVA_01140 [Candidatus Brocadiia bacterium]
MTYYIAKDCGAGWEMGTQEFWGVAEGRQRANAARLRSGDVLLHFIDHVQAWAGYSDVTGQIVENTRDTDPDWRQALPWVFPITMRKRLSRAQIQLTRFIPDVAARYRQQAFTVVPEAEALLIIAAIDAAAAANPAVIAPTFEAKWKQGADQYYGGIAKRKAKHRCQACGADGHTWAREHLRGPQQLIDEGNPPDWFLDAAHIRPRGATGEAIPDNLRALCRNCHYAIDRLPEPLRTEFLKGLHS